MGLVGRLLIGGNGHVARTGDDGERRRNLDYAACLLSLLEGGICATR